MKKRVFIVHGWDGSPNQKDWIPWLKKELENKGYKVQAPYMPNSSNPKIEIWIPFLNQTVGDVDQNTFFVGHSIGCQTIIRYLERLPSHKKVGGAVLIAPFFTLDNLVIEEDKKIAKPWLETPIDFEEIKRHCRKFVAIFSDNDPDVSLRNKEMFEQKLSAKTFVEHQKGHFSEDAGITQLPIALKSILEIALET